VLEQSEVSERLLNRRDFFGRTWIFVGHRAGRREAEQFFTMRNPGTLGHKAVLT